MYVLQLDINKQKEIKQEFRNILKVEGLRGSELEWSVKDAMDSKLVDLAKIIDINNGFI